MTTYFSDGPDGESLAPTLITEAELESLLMSFVLGAGREPSLDQAKKVAEWAAKARIGGVLLNMALEGKLYVYCGDDGEMYFKKVDEEGG
jgi:hypothetical protein